MTFGRVLVTGASGFVGRRVVAALSDDGWEVHACARRVLSGSAGTWHAADLLDPAAARGLVTAVRPTHLMHLAWCVTPGRFWTDPSNVDWVEATLRLCRAFAAAGGMRIVAAGTCAEYEAGSGVCHETDTAIAPTTLYATCKAATASVLSQWSADAELDFAWARLFHLYGPAEPQGRLVGDVVDALRAGRPVDVSAGTQVRDYLHVDDAAEALAALLLSSLTGPVNVGSGEPTSVRAIVELLSAEAGEPDLVRFGAEASSESPLLVADIERLRSTGWAPRRPLGAGLADAFHRREA